ncbi:hypothetical protein HanPSC8_Chr08g0315831 [Helianthus annuus]|nr:hypothetical protein HanPSC8_Chr08g0315831 [Helianthus annuus]
MIIIKACELYLPEKRWTSAGEEVDQTSAVCKKKTVFFSTYADF